MRAVYGKLQISSLAEEELAAKDPREGQGHANEGWFIDKDVVSETDLLLETVVKSN